MPLTRKATLKHVLQTIGVNSSNTEYIFNLEITSVGDLVAFTKTELEDIGIESGGEIKKGTIKKLIIFKEWMKEQIKNKDDINEPFDYENEFTEEAWDTYLLMRITEEPPWPSSTRN